ncbi:cytochrome c biogenesis protein [Calycomorphotria hydatis]|uniref:Cytochrome c biogenesis protein CcsA n=1 Tax=Calycomorphotria hydatis TaxID=2528027 RepID=A0A517T4Y0_9PLAN|nr:cytochrome c biogenesis protein CcsA [Calycomorphotria hydatis]QDT63436.1 Cytochrome c biogenesis protein CcsA [Calycomorphotria hydatis]
MATSRPANFATSLDAPAASSKKVAKDLDVSPFDVQMQILRALASLKLTVVLFALAIVIVFTGTLAQHRKDIWDVVHQYFRCSFAYIEFQDLLPPSFFPSNPQVPGGIWFPGGWLIGGLMFVNLFAAHAVRFKVQAKGTRLWAGLGVIAAGSVLTWLVVTTGMTGSGVQDDPLISWSFLWNVFRLLLGVAFAANVAGLIYLYRPDAGPNTVAMKRVLWMTAPLISALAIWAALKGEIDPSSMRILWQLMKGTLAGVVLLIGCMLAFKKRAGIVLLHAGVALLMFSELLVGLYAEEAQMRLAEGETKSYVEDIRTVELAVIDPSGEETDRVTSIPRSMLVTGETISDEALPFDIEIVDYQRNSTIKRVSDPEKNPATDGAGLRFEAVEIRPGTGVDTDAKVDLPSAYIRLLDKQTGKPISTRLVSSLLTFDQLSETVNVDGVDYKVALRFKRSYRPFEITLNDVRKDDYIGTDTPRNYSSEVQIVSDDGQTDREVKIWMNNPLRFEGETFYQSGYFRDPSTGQETTTLQVAKNEAWMLPYVSCMIVAVGMVAQFLVTLLRFLGKQARTPNMEAKSTAKEDAETTTLTSGLGRHLTWAIPLTVVLVFGGYLAGKAMPPKPVADTYDLYQFGQIPVLYQGRAKPLDTVARNIMRQLIGNYETYKEPYEENGETKYRTEPAIQFLLDIIAKPEAAFEQRVFRIENLELLDSLELERRKGFRYGFAEFAAKLEKLSEQANRAREVRSQTPEKLSLYQRKVLDLESRIGLLDLMLSSFQPDTQRLMQFGPERGGIAAYKQAYEQFKSRRSPPLAVKYEGDWQTLGYAQVLELVSSIRAAQVQDQSFEMDPQVQGWSEIITAYQNEDHEAFNKSVAAYLGNKDYIPPGVSRTKVEFESYFNHFAPFFLCWVLYIVAFVLTAGSWLVTPIGWDKYLRSSAFWLCLTVFAVHTFALGARIYISGRPPVTNLYSSAVFIGWAAVLFGLVLERMFGYSLGNAVASVSGVATLLIAHSLAGDGDTFVVLQAVLDTQFWLATHVVCISLGYTTTYVAGLVGIVYLIARLLNGWLDLPSDLGKSLSRMIYGTLCFAIFFSFVGTVLGGLWADDSWGRFWGWDPKENGALMIVLWNALVLHARWGKMVDDRGVAALAVAGNAVVSWSWFGVNELGVGLHSYGFTEGVLKALGLFVISQLVIMMLAFIPSKRWSTS